MSEFVLELTRSQNQRDPNLSIGQYENLKLLADDLERNMFKSVLQHIFQESEQIERYPSAYRERFDMAFSQTVITNAMEI